MIPEKDYEDAMFQISRMAQLEGYPRFPGDEVARAELLKHACDNADSIETMRRVVDEIMATHTRCPFPSDLAGMCYKNSAHKRFGCAACNYTGWRIVTRGDATGALKCECRP